jgi:sugar transferase (PEP-CTERM/EpsH1 system associated)
MANLLFLAHRLPYPPDKGDKVRSYHLLKHLSKQHRVFVGTFVDDPLDEPHVSALRARCADLHVERLEPRRARIASLAGLARGDALTMHYYRNAALAAWIDRTVRERQIGAAIVFSSAMAPYLEAHPALPMLVDFVDVDSAKWGEYAPRHRWPMSWVYRREGRLLLAAERRIALRARTSFFATDKEAALFHRLAPESRARVEAFDNGVDAEHFAPDPGLASPFGAGVTPIVFTGAMDYWPNVDAVVWFAREVLPALRRERPQLRLVVVGRNPTAAVCALAGEAVTITGTVPDVRPFLQHAAVVVAPLRLARGIQNKILEAMAMARPVVAATPCVEAMHAEPGHDVRVAVSADEFVREVARLLDAPADAEALGAAARRCVLQRYSWDRHLARLDRHLAAVLPPAAPASAEARTVSVEAAAPMPVAGGLPP